MLTLHGVERAYKKSEQNVLSLQSIDLEVAQSEIYGILGRTGSGKGALLRCINYLIWPTTGYTIFENQNLSQVSKNQLVEIRSQMGMVFAHSNLLDSRTVMGNITLPLELANAPTSKMHHYVMPVVELLGLTDKLHTYPSQLSPYNRQLVSLARAVVKKPKLLLCEDVTQNLDTRSTHKLLKEIKKIYELYKTTVVLVTNEIEVIKTLCHKVAVLHKGRLIEKGPVVDFFIRPQTDIGRDYIRAITKMEMPTYIRKKIQVSPTVHSSPVLRIIFQEQHSQEPLIAAVIQQHKVKLNILQAHMEDLQGVDIGILIVELIGEQSNISSTINFLESKSAQVEVLGYVPRNY